MEAEKKIHLLRCPLVMILNMVMKSYVSVYFNETFRSVNNSEYQYNINDYDQRIYLLTKKLRHELFNSKECEIRLLSKN
jgi:hypothetical protein